jgi:acetyl-CoA acetyltransferase
VGATGVAQIFEIVQQLRGEAGARQVKGAKIGMTHNTGGILGVDGASMVLHIFEA